MISRSWMFEPDYFLIQKGWGVYDLDMVMEAFINGQDGAVGSLLALPHHDVRDSELSGVEIDAMDMAIRNGLVPREVFDVIHNGPTDPAFENAAKYAIQAGAQIINTGIEQQNQLNAQRGIQSMPPAFTSDRTGAVQVNAPWIHGASSELHGVLKPGTRQVNPFFNDQLVTHIISTSTKKEEGWARPYEEALQLAGREETKRNDRYIRAHKDFSNRNLISFNDNNQAIQMEAAVKQHFQEAAANGMGREEAMQHAKEAWMQDKRSFHMTGHWHHAPESTLGRVIRPDDGEEPILDEQIEQEAAMQDGVAPDAAPVTQPNSSAIIHPDHRDTGWYRNMVANANHSLYNPDTGRANRKVIDYLSEHHHMDEQQATEFVQGVRMNRTGGNTRKRFDTQLLDHHIRTTSNVPEWFDETPPPSVAEAMNASEAALPVPQPEVQPIEYHTTPPPQPRPEAPPPLTPPEAGTPPPQTLSPVPGFTRPSNINSEIPLSGITQQGIGGGGVMDQIATILGRLAGDRTVLRSEDATEVEQYLENVQLELAKATIEDKFDVPTFDIDSPTDLAMMGAHIQRPTTDVISILFTKGDWRNIAKTLGVKHEQVQMVKVAFS